METDGSNLLIYGSYGYTGQLIVKRALEKGWRPLLAGRNAQKLKAQADPLGLEALAFSLDDRTSLETALSRVDAVLHVAGPYAATTPTMLDACIKTQTHYLDITGEIEVFEYIADRDQEIREAGITAIPGIGFDVVPTDCMAVYLKRKMPNATHIELGFRATGALSRGTARTMLNNIERGGMERKNGQLTPIPGAHYTRELPFGKKNYLAMSIPWGDVATAYYSTGIENVRAYAATSPSMLRGMKIASALGCILGLPPVQFALKAYVDATIDGPSQEIREKARSYIWGEVRNAEGERMQAVIKTIESYKLTGITATMVAERVLNGDARSGFHTPAQSFGPDFIMEVAGTERQDLEEAAYAQ